MKISIIIASALSVACATHAPMSEMVMFNKSIDEDTTQVIRNTGFTIFHHQPDLERFEEENNAQYNYRKTSIDFSISDTFVKSNKLAFSISAGTGVGVDMTKNIFEKFYATASVSAIRNQAVSGHDILIEKNRLMPLLNYYVSIQRPLINSKILGIGAGLFYHFERREYRIKNIGCLDCESKIKDFGIISLNSYGFKSTFLIQNKQHRRKRLVAYTKISKLVDYNEFYLSAGIVFITK